MFLSKYLENDSENYYIPFVDLMSGVVFILMIILSAELMNIKYPETKVVVNTPVVQETPYPNDPETIELFKKKLISSISSYLNKNNIKNEVSEDYKFIVVYSPSIFEKKSLSLNNKGKIVASKISEAFNKYLFFKSEKNNIFKKYLEYIKSISINIVSSQKETSKNSGISKSFVFYGYLVNLNPVFLTFANNYNQRLVQISDTRFIPETLSKDLEKQPIDAILLNFEFCYPKNKEVLW